MILGWDPARVRVFVVGILEWRHADDYPPFPQERRRDQRLVEHFRAQGIPADQIVYLQDRAATTATVRDAFDDHLAAARPGDLLVVYFAGHGARSDRGVTYFASHDAGDPRNHGWPVAEIPKAIERHFGGSHALLLADCCYSGGLADAVDDHGDRVAYATLVSSLASELSTGNWTFTEGIYAALRGQAYADSDGSRTITLREMADQVAANLAFAEEQLATFRIVGDFDPQTIVAAARPRPSADVGRRVEVLQNDVWYPAQIIDSGGGRFHVHYFGYDDTDDEWVTADRIREAKRPRYPAGTLVEVLWNKEWYPARVHDCIAGVHHIHYDGYDHSNDEWVSTARIRPRARS
ncbi:MAG: caspase family protein [Ardenticatenales bacterium]|nr:caspase family protein [Ardenticatenales bacterium]